MSDIVDKDLIIACTADNHLGYRFGYKLGPEGYNQREQDFYATWHQMIDSIAASAASYFIIAGDLFDEIKPESRALDHGIRGLQQLHEAGKIGIIIEGNHTAPRLRQTGSVMQVLERIFPTFHFVYNFEPKTIELEGNITVHAIPHCRTDEDLKRFIEEAKPQEGKINILTLHFGLIELPEFQHLVPGSQQLSKRELPDGFDWIVAGHFHGYRQDGNFFYTGSTERTSFNESIHAEKGFVWLNLTKKTVMFEALDSRPMIQLGEESMLGKSEEEILEYLEELKKSLGGFEGKMIRLQLTDIATPVFRSIDRRKVKQIVNEALYFDPDLKEELPPDMPERESTTTIKDLSKEWKEFIDGRHFSTDEDKEFVRDNGFQLLLGDAALEVLASGTATDNGEVGQVGVSDA